MELIRLKPDRKQYHREYYCRNRLWAAYVNMMARCYNSGNPAFIHYGERGIRVCDEWRYSFEAFKTWAINNGWNSKLEIDRINNDGDYAPENCECIGGQINKQKRRTSKLTLADAIDIKYLLIPGILPQREIAKRFNVTRMTINDIHLGRTWRNACAAI